MVLIIQTIHNESFHEELEYRPRLSCHRHGVLMLGLRKRMLAGLEYRLLKIRNNFASVNAAEIHYGSHHDVHSYIAPCIENQKVRVSKSFLNARRRKSAIVLGNVIGALAFNVI